MAHTARSIYMVLIEAIWAVVLAIIHVKIVSLEARRACIYLIFGTIFACFITF
jgi:hypothetical protein